MGGRIGAGGALALAAGILLILSVFLSWYTVTITSSSGTTVASLNLYPGQSVSLSSTSGSLSSTYSTSYANAGLNNTGYLYTLLEIILVGGAILGLSGAGLLVGAAGRGASSTARRWGENLVILVIGLAVIVLVMMPVAQPMVLSNDSYHQGANSSGGGPTTSYFGTEPIGSSVATWGPGPGWYVTIISVILLALGLGLAISGSRADTRQNEEPSLTYRGSAYPGPADPWGGPERNVDWPPVSPHTGASFQVSSPPAPASSLREERYCPACGQGNARLFAFCVNCGRALPPPP